MDVDAKHGLDTPQVPSSCSSDRPSRSAEAQWECWVAHYADFSAIIVVNLDTGKVIAINHIDPDKTYWRNTMEAPGRWPRAS